MTEPEYLEESEDELPPTLEDYYCTRCAWRGKEPDYTYFREDDSHRAQCPRCGLRPWEQHAGTDAIEQISEFHPEIAVVLRADHVLALLRQADEADEAAELRTIIRAVESVPRSDGLKCWRVCPLCQEREPKAFAKRVGWHTPYCRIGKALAKEPPADE